MNQYVTGTIIKKMREKKHLTQAQLAEKISVSDKTVSKWETGKGYPDITLLETLAEVFQISVSELLSGNTFDNTNVSANMLNTQFYVCPICGNIINSVGGANISCHGVSLSPISAEPIDDNHKIDIKIIDDECYVEIEHDMTKLHYISFIVAIYFDGIKIVKLYPEGNASTRFTVSGLRKIYFYCNKDGMYYVDKGNLRINRRN